MKSFWEDLLYDIGVQDVPREELSGRIESSAEYLRTDIRRVLYALNGYDRILAVELLEDMLKEY